MKPLSWEGETVVKQSTLSHDVEDLVTSLLGHGDIVDNHTEADNRCHI